MSRGKGKPSDVFAYLGKQLTTRSLFQSFMPGEHLKRFGKMPFVFQVGWYLKFLNQMNIGIHVYTERFDVYIVDPCLCPDIDTDTLDAHFIYKYFDGTWYIALQERTGVPTTVPYDQLEEAVKAAFLHLNNFKTI